MKRKVRVYPPIMKQGGNSRKTSKQFSNRKEGSQALQNEDLNTFGQKQNMMFKDFVSRNAIDNVMREALPAPMFEQGGPNPYLDMYIDRMQSMQPDGSLTRLFDTFTNIVTSPGDYKMKTVIDKPYRKEYRQLNREYNKDMRQKAWENWNDPYGVMQSYIPQYHNGGGLPKFQTTGETKSWLERQRAKKDPNFSDVGRAIANFWKYNILGEPIIAPEYIPGTLENHKYLEYFDKRKNPPKEPDPRIEKYNMVRDLINSAISSELTDEEYQYLISDFIGQAEEPGWTHGQKKEMEELIYNYNRGNSYTIPEWVDLTRYQTEESSGDPISTANVVQQAITGNGKSSTGSRTSTKGSGNGATGTGTTGTGTTGTGNEQPNKSGNTTLEELGLTRTPKPSKEDSQRTTGSGQNQYDPNYYGQFMNNPYVLYPKVRGTFSRTGRMPLFVDPRFTGLSTIETRKAILPGNRIKRITFDHYMPGDRQRFNTDTKQTQVAPDDGLQYMPRLKPYLEMEQMNANPFANYTPREVNPDAGSQFIDSNIDIWDPNNDIEPFNDAQLINDYETARTGGEIPINYIGLYAGLQPIDDYETYQPGGEGPDDGLQYMPNLYDLQMEQMDANPFANYTPRQVDPDLVDDTIFPQQKRKWGSTFLTHSRNWAPMMGPAMDVLAAFGRRRTVPDFRQQVIDMTAAENVFTSKYGNRGFNTFNPIGFDPGTGATPVQFTGFKCGGSKRY